MPHVRLVIVESPNKTAKIRGFLGPGYRVAASFGHVRDLPASGDLAVAFHDGRVEPRYQPLDRAGRALQDLGRLANEAEEVLLATDPDREGEAIAWHLAQALGPRPYRRVVFHAITKAAVSAAIASPRALDQRLVDAQQARRVLDRVVGWLVSPTLRRLGKDARSAGRVQSVALRLVAEREREIERFRAVDYFVLAAKLAKPGSPPPFVARLAQWKGEPLGQRLTEQAVADKSVEWCRRQRFVVHACDRRERDRHPPAPFTTATVQQAASVRLKLAPDATMKLLQSLFEGGHITYHRTDSVALAPEAVQAARAIIAKDFPKKYLPERAVAHAAKSANAQEAHELQALQEEHVRLVEHWICIGTSTAQRRREPASMETQSKNTGDGRSDPREAWIRSSVGGTAREGGTEYEGPSSSPGTGFVAPLRRLCGRLRWIPGGPSPRNPATPPRRPGALAPAAVPRRRCAGRYAGGDR